MCEACLFCIYPLSAAVCTVLFPRTPEHSRRPPSNPEPQRRGPHVHICKGDALRFKLFARYYACLLDLGCRENKVPVGGLRGQPLRQHMHQLFQPAQGNVRVVFGEENGIVVYFKVICFLLRNQESCCASGLNQAFRKQRENILQTVHLQAVPVTGEAHYHFGNL